MKKGVGCQAIKPQEMGAFLSDSGESGKKLSQWEKDNQRQHFLIRI
jgi:hypothetical protein